MPVTMDPRDRKLMLGALCVFIALIAGGSLFGGSGAQSDVPSTYSSSSGGAKAAYLLLTQSGYKVQRWEKPLTQLPGSGAATLVLAEPHEAPTRQDKQHLQDFVRQGGTVIATGMFAGTYLPENESIPELLEGMVWKKVAAAAPSAITRAAPEIVIAPEARWMPYSPVYPLYGDSQHLVVVKYPYGKGSVLWWASATPLTNAGLREAGNLEFLLACLGDRNNEILWDEYIHGYRETLALSVAHSPVKWIVLQLTLLGLAVLVTFSRRNGPVFKPSPVNRLSPLEFVQTLGGLYERAGTASVAVDICYQRFRYWLGRRLGIGSQVPLAELETVVRNRWTGADEHFVAILRQCESAKNDPYLQANEALHLVQELDEFGTRFRLFEGGRKEKS